MERGSVVKKHMGQSQMLKKIAAGIAVLLVVTQIVFIVLQIIQVLKLPNIWLFAPMIVGLFVGMIFVVGYVLWAEKKEKL